MGDLDTYFYDIISPLHPQMFLIVFKLLNFQFSKSEICSRKIFHNRIYIWFNWNTFFFFLKKEELISGRNKMNERNLFVTINNILHFNDSCGHIK